MDTNTRKYQQATVARELGAIERRHAQCVRKFGHGAAVTRFWKEAIKGKIVEARELGYWSEEMDNFTTTKARAERDRAIIGKPMLESNYR